MPGWTPHGALCLVLSSRGWLRETPDPRAPSLKLRLCRGAQQRSNGLATTVPSLCVAQLYNAHTVGCDALWAGVPMVTLRGAKMASRVGASLVEAAGMPELVTGSLEEYTQLVLALAR